MYRLRLLLTKKRPTLHDLVQGNLSKSSEAVFKAAFEDARKEQAKILKQAKSLSK